MSKVLITAFEPYDEFKENSSWLALVELVRDLPREPQTTTRLYPVDLAAVKERLAEDLRDGYDFVMHVGQAPGRGTVLLEAIGVNVSNSNGRPSDDCGVLAEDGPVAYRTALPIARWAEMLREAKIPTRVSYHAGTYLCNATLYWSHYLAEKQGLGTRTTFVHLPLDVSQVAQGSKDTASLPAETSARALRLMLGELHAGDAPTTGERLV